VLGLFYRHGGKITLFRPRRNVYVAANAGGQRRDVVALGDDDYAVVANMDIEKTGELEHTAAEEVFAAVFRARAYGVVHFKSPEGADVFVTFERGLAQHASGGGLEGEAAVKAVLSWREGDYRFIDDIRPDDEDFPPNVPAGVAERLGGPAEAPVAEVLPPTPPPAVLPAGEDTAGVNVPGTAEALLATLGETGFTGCCAVGPAANRRGFFVFVAGEARGIS
jgi:hypothetical protein